VKLPEKKYFSLDEVAEKLQCTKYDLLHYGATSQLLMAVYVELSGVHLFDLDFNDIGLGRSGYYYIDGYDIGRFERNKELEYINVTSLRLIENMYDLFEDPFALPPIILLPSDMNLGIDLNQLVVFRDDLYHFCYEEPTEEQLPSSDNLPTLKKENPKSIDSLTKMVIAMAIDGYGFDPTEKKSPIPGQITQCVETLGFSIDIDTVRKWLKAGADIIPRDGT